MELVARAQHFIDDETPAPNATADALRFPALAPSGEIVPGRFLVLSVLPDPEAQPFRFGIILTKKVGNAVVRNRVRRRIRGLLSKFGERIVPGHQLVIIARYTSPDAGFEEFEKDWLKQLRRAGILREEVSAEG